MNITTVAAFINLPTYVITIISEYVLIKRGILKSTRANKIRLFAAFGISIAFLYFGWMGSMVPYIYWVIAGLVLMIGVICYPLFVRRLRE